jgi:parallel beta-helix repeat protein
MNRKAIWISLIFLLLLTSLFLMANSSEQTKEQTIHAQALSLTSTSGPSVPPAVEWQKILPSDLGTSATCIIQTSDGGYAVSGDGNYKNGAPGYLVKLDASGNIQWNQSYFTKDKYSNDIQSLAQTSDGGYILLIAWSELIKTDAQGNFQWNITFTGVTINSMIPINGGYVLAGDAATAIIRNGRTEDNFWLAKVNSAGTMLWNKTYGGPGDNQANSVIQTSDGGYALAGESNAFSSAGEYDFMIVKTDSSGNQQWLKTFGGAGGDSDATSLVQSSDGDYVLAGYTSAYGLGGNVAWLVKTDSSGNLIWTQTYGNSASEVYSLIQTSDRGLAFAGEVSTPNLGANLVWIVKTDASGNPQWNETFGETENPYSTWAGNSLIETSDGGFAIACYDQPPGFPWEGSYFVVKTEPALPPPSASPPLTPSPTASPSPVRPPVLEFPSTTINVDGSVSPASAPIQRSGNVYTFTGNLNGQLIVDRDNVVVDGDGYSLQGNGSAGNLYIRLSETGLNITGRTNVTIINLQIYNYNYGVYLDNSTNATISGTAITLDGYGIFEAASTFANISSNNIAQNNYDIYVNTPSENNQIINNNIDSAMSFGITLNDSSGNVIFNNNLTKSGIDDESSSNNLITGNLMYSSTFGVYLNGATDSIIAANNFTACSSGIYSPGGASGNLIYMNDFNDTYANAFAGNQKNTWDNGTDGNYWSDYQTRYPNATEIDNSGIGDAPYTVSYGYIPASLGPAPNSNKPNPNDVDHYPLLFPVSSASAEALAQTLVSAHSWSPTSTPSPSTDLVLFASLASVVVVIVLVAIVILRRRKKQAQATLTAPSQLLDGYRISISN